MSSSLSDQLQELIHSSRLSAVGLAARRLEDDDEVLSQAHAPFHPASVMKVCVMMEVFHQAHAGGLSLDDPILITNSFRSILDGSEFSLDAADDSDKALYACLGQHRSRRDLVRRMIAVSSNLATNILLEQVSPEQVTAFMHQLGAADILVRRGVEDKAAFRAGLNNSGTARGFMHILSLLAARKVVSPDASDEMIEMLLQQEFNEMIPAALPAGTRVAHKTGWIADYHHDAGIVFPRKAEPFVLCIFTKGYDESQDAEAHALVAALARTVYDHWVTRSA